MKDFKESDLSKVLPSEGGKVFVFSMRLQGIISRLDLKEGYAIVTAKDESLKVKLNDLCKINS